MAISDIESRFHPRVARGGPDECWEWLGARIPEGYGSISMGNHRQVGAHRVAWEIANGRPVPAGLCVCHTCDNPPCVNPAHLFLGTHKDNAVDRARKGRQHDNAGTRHGMAKLTEDQVIGVLRYRHGGESQAAVAERFGVSRATIYRIESGKNWTHLTGLGK